MLAEIFLPFGHANPEQTQAEPLRLILELQIEECSRLRPRLARWTLFTPDHINTNTHTAMNGAYTEATSLLLCN